MKTLLTILILLAFCAPAAAETTDAELQQLLLRAQQALNSPGNAADKHAAAHALRRAIAELERHSDAHIERHTHASGRRDACVDLGAAAYAETSYETVAFENAVRACGAKPVDPQVLAVAFAVYRKNAYQKPAFEAALLMAQRRELFGKVGMLQLAKDVYATSLYEQTALEKAATLVGSVHRGGEACIRRGYELYTKSLYPGTALEKAVQTCQRD